VVITARKMMTSSESDKEGKDETTTRIRALQRLPSGFAPAALAQSYPSRPVKVIVPVPARDAADILSPLSVPKMAERNGTMTLTGLDG